MSDESGRGGYDADERTPSFQEDRVSAEMPGAQYSDNASNASNDTDRDYLIPIGNADAGHQSVLEIPNTP